MSTEPTADLLKQKLIHYLDSLESAVRSGGDFVATQAPEVVREMVAYRLAVSCAICVAAVIGMVTSLVFLRSLSKWNEANKGKLNEITRQDTAASGLAAIGVLFVASLIAFGFFANTALKCWIAPKYFVLEQVAEMLKK